MRHCLFFLLAVLMVVGAAAQNNQIYIEDFEIYPDSTSLVPVMLANTDSTRGVQFYMTMPEGLDVAAFVLNDYANAYDMLLETKFSTNLGCYVVFEYPASRICFPPDTTAVLMIEFCASSDFGGGELTLWQCRGATIDNRSISMTGCTTNVTVPESSIIGIPMDNAPESNQYFNLLGQPVIQPDTVPVVIEVTTHGDGHQSSRKMSFGH